MKKLFILLAVTAQVATALADYTPTNAVKVSQLGTATTPLTGAELVPVVQSGSTKSATVGQICNGPTTLANAAQTYAQQASNTLAAATVLTNAAGIAFSQAVSNSLTSALNTSNTVYITRLVADETKQIGDAAAGTNNAMTVSNSVTQALNLTNATLHAQILAIQTTAGSGIQNGGNGVLSTALITNLYTPSTALTSVTLTSGTVGVNLDGSKGNFFRLLVNATAVGTTLSIGMVNFSDGEQVYLEIVVNPASQNFTLRSGATYTGGVAIGPPLAATASANQYWLMNWIIVNTDVIFSGGKVQ